MKISTKFRQFAFYLILFLIPIIIIELSLRVFFAYKISPNVFFFGTGWFQTDLQKDFDPRGYYFRKMTAEKDNVAWHSNLQQNYSKYSPGEIKTDFDEDDKKFSIKINKYGFRGKDWEIKKKEGVIRVVTLGASSTFGYRDRDDQTYPYYLEVFLNNKIGPGGPQNIKGFEVINLGIPHQKAFNIYALFVKEALPLHPDVITFYEGSNDVDLDQADWKMTLQQNRFLHVLLATYQELRQRFITLAFASNVANNILIKSKASRFTGKDTSENKSDPSPTLETINKNIEASTNQISLNFFRYLELIRDECKQRQILFVVSSQQAFSGSISRDKLNSFTYKDEVSYIKSLLVKNESITRPQYHLLCHAILMARLAQWAHKNKVVFVDGIKALDHDRSALLSWVHLSPQGNRILAQELATAIYDNICKADLPGR